MARSRIVTAAIAAVTLLVVLQPVLAYNQLRESCVHNLQVPTLSDNRNWWWETFGDGTPMPAFDYDNRSAKQEMEIWLADHLDPLLPDFLDRRNSRIYIPLLPEHGEPSPTCDWPREWIEHLCIRGQYAQHAHAGEPCHIAGLRDILMHDPVTLIDWLQTNGASSLRDTTARFFRMHITIIGLVAFAAGITFAPANMLARELAESIT